MAPRALQTSERRHQPDDPVRCQKDRRGHRRRTEKDRPEQGRRQWTRAGVADDGAGDGGQQDQPKEAKATVHQHHRRCQRLRTGRSRRVGNPDDVAADVARQEIIEERRDEKRADQRARGDADPLRVKQQAPPPGAGEHHHQVEHQRRGEPADRGRPDVRPESRSVAARDQQDQQPDADDHLRDEQQLPLDGRGRGRGTLVVVEDRRRDWRLGQPLRVLWPRAHCPRRGVDAIRACL
jgi:hypothetical protein